MFLSEPHLNKLVEEQVTKDRDGGYIGAVVYICEDRGISFASISKILPRSIKEEMRKEGENRNLLKKLGLAKLKFFK